MVEPISDQMQTALVGGGGGLLTVGVLLITNFPDLKDLGVILVLFGAVVYALKELPGAQSTKSPTDSSGAQKTQGTPSCSSVAIADDEPQLLNYLRDGYTVAGTFEFANKKRVYLTKK